MIKKLTTSLNCISLNVVINFQQEETTEMDSQEIGLSIGLILGNYLLNSEQLHYGYWTEDLPVTLNNFSKAQENYMHFIIDNFPKGINTVLDVGCGAGVLAEKLTQLGYQVDCITPSKLLYTQTIERLGNGHRVFNGNFEDFESENQYDMVLFSESFQYIVLHEAISKAFNLLNKGGNILICDFFKRDTSGKSPLGGGHKLSKFYDTISQHAFMPVTDIDITHKTAPTMTLVSEFLDQVGKPVWQLANDYMEKRRPLISKFLAWKYRKKIDKINRKYFSGLRNAESFEKHKSYRFMLYQK